MNSNLPWSEQFRLKALEWNEANAAAALLEDTKSAVLSQWMVKLGDMPVTRAELLVKASPEWSEHVEQIIRARERANVLQIEKEVLRMRFHEWSSEEANKRHEARL